MCNNLRLEGNKNKFNIFIDCLFEKLRYKLRIEMNSIDSDFPSFHAFSAFSGDFRRLQQAMFICLLTTHSPGWLSQLSTRKVK